MKERPIKRHARSVRLGRLAARAKVWLEADGQAVFGDGKLLLLETIARAGSIRAAAEKLGMSYRGLWGRLAEMEKRLGLPLVRRTVGGKGGGGAALTEQAAELIQHYRRFRGGINELIDQRFARAFGGGAK